METFDLSKLTEELRKEIQACKTPEELKALLTAKHYAVPDSKLEAILQLLSGASSLDLEDLEKVSGGVALPDSFCRCS